MTAQPLDRKAALRDAAADFILAHGLGDLSLHRLAEELGTSTGMLVHWFGSREALVAEALAAIRDRQRDAIRAAAASGGEPASLADALRRHWRWLSAEEQEPYLRLYFAVQGMALHDPVRYPEFNEHAVSDWLTSVEELQPPGDGERGPDQPNPTLVVAAVRGLLLDLLATGDRERVEQAFERLVAVTRGP